VAPKGAGRAGSPFEFVTRSWADARLALSLVRLRPFDTSTPLGRSNERYRRIGLTTLSSLASRGVASVVGLVTVPLLLAHLGKEQFGLWSTITTVIAWVALFDFGIANGLVNLLSRAHGRDDEADARRHFSTAVVLLTAMAVALGAAVAVAAPRVPWSSLLAVRGAIPEATVRWAVVAALGVFVVGMPLSVVQQVYAAYQRSYVGNLLAVVGVLVGFGAIVACVRAGGEIPALVLAFGAGSVLTALAGMVHILLEMGWLRPRLAAVSAAAARELLARSVPMFLFQLGALTVNETQAIILAHRCDLAVVADYSILMRLYALAIGVIHMSTASFLPSFREAVERGDHPWMRASFVRFLQARMVLALGAALVLGLGGNLLIRAWLRRSDVAFSPAVWGVLALLLLATSWVTAHSDLLAIMDRLWVNVALVLVNGAVTVSLTYALAPSLQILGVVVATAFVTTGFYVWVVPWLARALVLRARG
jgi:O-antigen/teichoic acid export membrane protein